MRFLKSLILAFAVLTSGIQGFAAENAVEAATQVGAKLEAAGEKAGEAKEESGLPAESGRIHHIGPLVITNSMLLTLIVALGLIVFAQLATRNMQAVPTGMQNFAEWMVEGLYNFLESILGQKLIKQSFWFFGSLFLYIMFTNWFGLIPGVGTIGWGHMVDGHFHLQTPLLRGGNADLNATTALSIIFFALWIYWAVQANGVVGLFKHIFVSPSKLGGFMGLFIGAIFLFVGAVEVISIVFRPVSLSFRLFGNVFAGENILESLMKIHPIIGIFAPLPFYFLELLVGIVQALVFTLLTAVFTALICSHDHSHDEPGHGHGHKSEGHAH